MKTLKKVWFGLVGRDHDKNQWTHHGRQPDDFSSFLAKNNNNGMTTIGRNHALKNSKMGIILGRLPMQSRGKEIRKSKKVNRYLAFQELRIQRAVISENYLKATIIWCSILHRSFGYQLALFNRVLRGWYWNLSEEELSEYLISTSKRLRKWDLRIFINRFYILKKNGKFRPIGAPTPSSKIISKAFTDMVQCFSRDHRHEMQHGYRYQLGVHTALEQVISKIGPRTLILEFDFKSFFNTVSLGAVFKSLGKYGKYLAYTVSNMIATDTVRFKDGWKPEKEYELVSEQTYKKKWASSGTIHFPAPCNDGLGGRNDSKLIGDVCRRRLIL